MLPIFNHIETDIDLGKQTYFSAMVLMAEVDGPICKEEKKVVFKIADKLEVTEKEFANLLHDPCLHKLEFLNPNLDKTEFFFDLFKIIYSDGAINDKELKLLHNFVMRTGFSSSKATKIISRSMKVFESKVDFETYNNALNTLF